jgi:hypothetical protein
MIDKSIKPSKCTNTPTYRTTLSKKDENMVSIHQLHRLAFKEPINIDKVQTEEALTIIIAETRSS